MALRRDEGASGSASPALAAAEPDAEGARAGRAGATVDCDSGERVDAGDAVPQARHQPESSSHTARIHPAYASFSSGALTLREGSRSQVKERFALLSVLQEVVGALVVVRALGLVHVDVGLVAWHVERLEHAVVADLLVGVLTESGAPSHLDLRRGQSEGEHVGVVKRIDGRAAE